MRGRYKKTRDFREHVKHNILIDPITGCWLWQRAVQKINAKGRGGYAMCTYKGKWQTGHRAVWKEWVGEIPEDRQVNHSCDVRSCMNPDHMWLGTQKQNIHDAIRKGRWSYFGMNESHRLDYQWYTNGTKNVHIHPGQAVPRGYCRGMTKEYKAERYFRHAA